VKTEISISDELHNFIRDHARVSYSLQIILFFADHPCARFNEQTILHSLGENGGSHYVQKALGELVAEGMLMATNIDSRSPLYSLAEHNPSRDLILALSQMDMCRRQLVVGRNSVTNGKEDPSLNQNINNNAPGLDPVATKKRNHLPVGNTLTIHANWKQSKTIKA
jgi:hypothetical protein